MKGSGNSDMKIKPLVIGDLKARVPVIQGGMGVGVSLSGLAGSVALAGGIGVISAAQIGYRKPEWDEDPVGANLKAVGEEIRRAKEIAKGGIIGINIMVATKYYEKYVKAAVDAGVDLIISGAGLPVELPQIVGNAKVKLAPIVSSLKSLNVIAKYWIKKFAKVPDMVIIEGPLAGGHLGFDKKVLEDIPAMRYDEEIKRIIERTGEIAEEQNTSVPVITAGGIYDREDMEHYLLLGADGVQVATRFVTTEECDADIRYKESYIKAKSEDIEIVSSPVGMPGRAIHNRFQEDVKAGTVAHGKCHQCIKTCSPKDTPYCITDALIAAVKGDVEHGLLFCGANAYRAEKIEHVADIMKEFENDDENQGDGEFPAGKIGK